MASLLVGSALTKGLIYRVFVFVLVFGNFIRYPGSGVVLDCIDS